MPLLQPTALRRPSPSPPGDAALNPRVPAALVTAFVVYLLLLGWIVLFKLEFPWIGGVDRVIKLVPFAPSEGAGASRPAEVLANLVLFVPFGVYLGLLAPAWRWWHAAVVLAAASLALETTQFLLAIGSSDITDVLVNTAGGLAGFGLLSLATRRRSVGARSALARLCVIGTVGAVLAAAVFVASPIRMSPPPGGPGHRDSPRQAIEVPAPDSR